MAEESKTHSWFERNSWIFECIFFLGILIGTIWWVYHDRGFEPALAVGAAVAAFISRIFARGIKGLFFIFGLFGGAILAGILIILIPRFDAEIVKTELTQVQTEKGIIEKENSELKNKVSELETNTTNINTSDTEKALRQKIIELNSQIETLTQQKQGVDNSSNDTPTPISTPPIKPLASRTVDNIRLDVMSCISTGNDINVELMITNLGADRDELRFGNTSTLTNEKGDLFKANVLYLERVLNNVPRKVNMIYKDAGLSNKISSLEIAMKRDRFFAKFSNLPISR